MILYIIGGAAALLIGGLVVHKIEANKAATPAAAGTAVTPVNPAVANGSVQTGTGPGTPAAQAAAAQVSPAAIAAAAASAGMTPAQLDAAAAAAGTTAAGLILAAVTANPTADPSAAAAAAASALAVSQDPSIQAQINPGSGGQTAIVTTSDPAPAGDLAIRDKPSDDGMLIGAADKGGTVVILNANASADYAQIVWSGGRNVAQSGFAHKSFLAVV